MRRSMDCLFRAICNLWLPKDGVPAGALFENGILKQFDVSNQ
jgi:hypothetical protein